MVLAFGDEAVAEGVEASQPLGDSADYTQAAESLGDYDISFYVVVQPILDLIESTATGSDVRVRDDTMPTAHIALAVEGVSWSDDDYFVSLVTQAIVGNYDRSMGNASHVGSKLSSFVHKNELASSFMSFSTSYSDSG